MPPITELNILWEGNLGPVCEGILVQVPPRLCALVTVLRAKSGPRIIGLLAHHRISSSSGTLEVGLVVGPWLPKDSVVGSLP